MTTRAYRGRAPEQRKAERREKLLAAGLGLWGELGWPGVSVRGVCARSGLTDRYFYESFPDRDALLLAVFAQVRDDLAALIFDIPWEDDPRPVMNAMFTALLTALEADPRKARVAFTDPAGSPVLERARYDALTSMAETIAENVSKVAPGPLPEIQATALFCVAGVGGLINNWLAGGRPVTIDVLAARCTNLCALAFQVP